MTGNLLAGEEKVLKKAASDTRTFTSIIIPAYNEESGLPIVLEKIFRSVNGCHEVIVVDDGSQDSTATIAATFPCRVIRHRENCGKGAALKTGISHATGENVIFIDADDTYPADAILALTEALDTCDVVYGVRAIGRKNIPLLNRFGNLVFQTMIRIFYGFTASDYSTGLYGLKKRYFHRMRIASKGFSIEPEIAIKASRMNLSIKEIPIHYSPRVGRAKLGSFSGGYQHLKTITRHLFWSPHYKN